MLRAVLYESEKDFIAIEKEIALINNYIKIEQSRYGERLSVDFNIEGDIKAKIPPFVCFSLIENAFKHGASDSVGAVTIQISMRITDTELFLHVKNPLAQNLEPDFLGASKGIGIKNITKQLNLIFPNNYVLKTAQKNEVFISTLEIPLS